MASIRILIQNRESKQYLKNRRTWTPNVKSAKSFPTALSAFYFAAEAELHNVEIIWAREGSSAGVTSVARNSSAPSRAVIRHQALAAAAPW